MSPVDAGAGVGVGDGVVDDGVGAGLTGAVGWLALVPDGGVTGREIWLGVSRAGAQDPVGGGSSSVSSIPGIAARARQLAASWSAFWKRSFGALARQRLTSS